MSGAPGCGKTTWIARQVEKIVRESARDDGTSPVTICSLTRAAAAEVAGRRLPIPRYQIGTLHSMAYRSLGSPEIAEGHLDEWSDRFPMYRAACATKKDDLDGAGEPPSTNDIGDAHLADMYLRRDAGVPRAAWPAELGQFADFWDKWKKESGYLDFADLIEIAAEESPEAPGSPDCLIADEGQDLAKAEHRLLAKWGKAAGALILAGDGNQALYVWRGADPSIFYDGSIPEERHRRLKKSFRVPLAVRDAANKWLMLHLSTYQPFDYIPRDGDDGAVRRIRCSYGKPLKMIDEALARVADGDTAMILTSCSYMLVKVLAELRGRAVPFSNRWRRKRGDWNPLGTIGRRDKTSARDRVLALLRIDRETWGEQARPWTWDDLAIFCEVLQAKGVLRRGQKARVKREACSYDIDPDALMEVFEDDAHLDLMLALGDQDSERAGRLLAWLRAHALKGRGRTLAYACDVAKAWGPKALREEPRLTVGTIHSVKGAEADHVFLCPDVSPAALRKWKAGRMRKDSVTRTFYVGMTRARKSLTVLDARRPGMAVPVGMVV